ncbi:MAG: hypothetical protein ACKVP3_16165 [Hyphomicrobiaceae bacterium]
MLRGPIWLLVALIAAQLHPRPHMLDALMIGFALVFFALAVGYTYLCDRL